jgi:hypothetical protein
MVMIGLGLLAARSIALSDAGTCGPASFSSALIAWPLCELHECRNPRAIAEWILAAVVRASHVPIERGGHIATSAMNASFSVAGRRADSHRCLLHRRRAARLLIDWSGSELVAREKTVAGSGAVRANRIDLDSAGFSV